MDGLLARRAAPTRVGAFLDPLADKVVVLLVGLALTLGPDRDGTVVERVRAMSMPLALFVGGLTGCLMTQIRAFAKRLDVPLRDLRVETRVQWDWTATGRVYETASKSFEIDILIDSDAPLERQQALVSAAKKGCFIEQTLGQKNTITHRLKTDEGWVDAD